MASGAQEHSPIKAVLFDFMGTCLDWCTAVTAGLPQSIPHAERCAFALAWRVRYFYENDRRLQAGLPTENIDVTLARVLDSMLLPPSSSASSSSTSTYSDPYLSTDFSSLSSHFDSSPETKRAAIASWHAQPAWPDVAPALSQLRAALPGIELFVHANGTTRLQLDLIRSSGLSFDLLMSSQMLGQIKPAPEPYLRGLELIGRRAEECVLVAAHAYDVRGAKNVGMRTVYIHRDTDDVHEDLSGVDKEFDVVLHGMEGLAEAVASFQVYSN